MYIQTSVDNGDMKENSLGTSFSALLKRILIPKSKKKIISTKRFLLFKNTLAKSLDGRYKLSFF